MTRKDELKEIELEQLDDVGGGWGRPRPMGRYYGGGGGWGGPFWGSFAGSTLGSWLNNLLGIQSAYPQQPRIVYQAVPIQVAQPARAPAASVPMCPCMSGRAVTPT